MADTAFNPAPVQPVQRTETRDVFAERPVDTGKRVEPLQKQENPTKLKDQSREDRRAEIEELASSAMKNSRLSIKRDDDSGDFMYYMVDEDTGETVRRWPPESHADLVEFLRSKKAGLVDRQA